MNQLGDFLTGVVAPLAFLWLVVGYRIQAIEFSAQSEELGSQTEQLRAEVQATKHLAELAILQSKEIRNRMAPSFQVKYVVKLGNPKSSPPTNTFQALIFANYGNLVNNFQMLVSGQQFMTRHPVGNVKPGFEKEIFSGGGNTASFEQPIVGVLRCETLLQERLYFSFFINSSCDSCPLFPITKNGYEDFLKVARPEAKDGEAVLMGEAVYSSNDAEVTISNRRQIVAEAKKLYSRFERETRLD